MSTGPEIESHALLAESAPGDNSAPFTVTELSGRLKRHVEDGFGHVRVRGEISGWKRVASGHCYLALKDDSAALDGVMWKMSAARLAFQPVDGAEVVATGKLTTYPGRSKYQIIVDSMELAGEGAMLALLEKLKAKLAGEGLFDSQRKRPLPYLPKVIGVVTSPTGAVIRDILHRLEARFPTHVVVWPVLVQGTGAAEQIARAVRGFSAMAAGGPVPRPDLVIVARGGGSVEDLWCFNDEQVVRAVADCSIPTISAVGHETDTTLCDFAADVRAPTPTAAAEIAVPVRTELLAGVEALGTRSWRCVRRYHERGTERLTALAQRLPDGEALLAAQRQRVDDLGERMRRGLSKRLADGRGDLAHASAALRPPLIHGRIAQSRERLAAARLVPQLVARPIAEAHQRLDRIWRVAESLNPDAVLRRGYARVEKRDGGTIMTADAARRAGALTLVFQGDERVPVRTERAGAPPSPVPVQGSLL